MNEYQRFLKIRERRLPQPPFTGQMLTGRRVLVTGGTGCIGSRLLEELRKLDCAKLGSIAIGSDALIVPPGVHGYFCDIRDEPSLLDILERGWDVIIHCASQRDPGLAEMDREATITTNVGGMSIILSAASRAQVPWFVYASTGKALRPYSPDTYTATKRVAEWLLSRADIPYRAGARFTHVVDNSIVHRRLLRSALAGRPLKLHADGIMFYAQSAIESAQLLIGAADCAGSFEADIHAIRDLGEPIDLTAMAHGIIELTGSQSQIEFVGYDKGYESEAFPGLYDPETAFDRSPLVNAFEAAVAFEPYAAVDAFPLQFGRRVKIPCSAGLDTLSWLAMKSALDAVSPALAKRIAGLCHGRELIPEHRRMLEYIETRGAMA